MIIKERMTAHLEGDFVVFLIGMRINNLWKVHKWLPVVIAMGKMLKELYTNPNLGLIHHEGGGLARTVIIVQYWRSMDQLLDYAKSKDSVHLPAWRNFNKRVSESGAVGIWHETYSIGAGKYENIYSNMPAFGLGKAGFLQEVRGKRETAIGRLDN